MKKKFNLEKSLKIITILLIVTNIILLGANIYVRASEDVKLSVINKKKLEIVLSKNDSNMDVTNFKDDIYTELENQGVSKDRVIFHDAQRDVVSTEQSDVSTIFNSWGRAGYTGKWSYNASTGIIVNAENTDNLTGFYNNNNFEYQDITLSYDNTSTDSDDDAMGGMVRFNKNSDGTYSSYVFLIDQGGTIGTGLYKLQNASFIVNNLKTCQKVSKRWVRNTLTNYKIEAKGNNIKVYIDGTLIIDYKDTNNPIYKGSYGFFSYSQAQSMFKNIQIESVSYKTFKNVLSNTTFDAKKIHAIINIADKNEDEFSNNSTKGEILSKTINQGVSYIVLGTDANKEQSKEIIKENDNKGIFIDNTNYNEAIKNTATYIVKLLKDAEEKTNYIIAGEDSEFEITPEGIDKNTSDTDYPDGKWKLVHDYNYFENNNGQYANTGKYLSDFPTELNKVGRYKITFEDKAINPQYIYVHRRPKAIITMQRSDNTISLDSSKSYDLDKQSENNGIQEVEWSYKKVSDSNWTNGKLSNIEDGESYIIRLRVKDYQNTWSEYATKYVTSQDGVAPVAEFTILKDEITIYEKVNIIDNSYDPAGKGIINKEWKIKKNGTELETKTGDLAEYTPQGEGKYDIILTVTNSNGTKSDEYMQEFTATGDQIAPEVIAEPRTENEINENIKVKLQFSDEGGSGFKGYQYLISSNKSLSTEELNNATWSEESTGTVEESESSNTNKNITAEIMVTNYGDNYIYLKLKDNAGNENIVTLGNYNISNKTIDVEIEKTDLEDENKKLANAEMKIDNTIVTSDAEGKIKATLPAKKSKEQTYLITDTGNLKNVRKINPLSLKIKYDTNGNVIQADLTGSENATLENFEEGKIKIKIKNEIGVQNKIYYFENRKIYALSTFSRQEGIDKIIYNDENGKQITLNGNGNKKVCVDIVVTPNTDYIYKIYSIDGAEQDEVVNISSKTYVGDINLFDFCKNSGKTQENDGLIGNGITHSGGEINTFSYKNISVIGTNSMNSSTITIDNSLFDKIKCNKIELLGRYQAQNYLSFYIFSYHSTTNIKATINYKDNNEEALTASVNANYQDIRNSTPYNINLDVQNKKIENMQINIESGDTWETRYSPLGYSFGSINDIILKDVYLDM